MGVKFANNAYGTLNASIASGDTSLTLSSGQGARFPSLGAGDYFYATLIDTSNNLEIVKCTARSSDVLTITRGQEGTTARAYSVGDRVELRVTAAGLDEIQPAIDELLPTQTSNSGKYLTTDGTNSSWGTVDLTNLSASSLTSGTIPDARLGSGAILQAYSVRLNGTPSFSGSQNNWQATSLSQAITPSATSSKVLITLSGQAYHTSTGADNNFRLVYNVGGGAYNPVNPNTSPISGNSTGTLVGNYRGADEMQQGAIRVSWTTLHAPATTSQVIYRFDIATESDTLYLNRGTQSGSARFGSPVWELVVMEVKG